MTEHHVETEHRKDSMDIDGQPLDRLTGVLGHEPIRKALETRLLEDKNSRSALVVLNIDNFRLVNDSYGHLFGDEILTLVTQRIRQILRTDDIVGRIGGDEFIILLSEVASPVIASEICERLRTILRNPIHRGGVSLRLTASLGVALAGRHGDMAESLIRHATAAMTLIKRRGGDGVSVPQNTDDGSPSERLTLEQDLRDALDRREFELYYQPKFLSDGVTVVGAEALLRWHHPKRGMVSPGIFIPIAEDIGMIVALGDWVLREAMAARHRWFNNAGLRHVPSVAINISFRQFERPGFFEVVNDAVLRSGCEPNAVELELTETVLMLNATTSIETMRRLRAIGVGLSIDDFGTGYSSLSMLKRVPLNTLKIDRSFVMGLPESREDCAITRSIVDLATTLGFQTVAEGVETREQLDFLRGIGCTMIQGFLLAPPLPEEQFLALLKVQQRLAAKADGTAESSGIDQMITAMPSDAARFRLG